MKKAVMALTARIAFDGRSATAVTTVMALDEALETVIAGFRHHVKH